MSAAGCHCFDSDETDLYNILTKKVMDEKISKEILVGDKIGQNMFKEFVKGHMTDGKVSIWSPVKRRNIGTFKSANAVSDMKAGDKLIKIKKERGLLQRFIVAARSRPDLDLKKYIGKYEFGLIPRSLFASDGSLLLAYDKAKVFNHLEALIKDGERVLQGGENGAPVEGRSLAAELQNTEIEGCIEGDQESYKVLLIDAMALVNSINKTDQIIYCSDFANAFIEKLINISIGYNEVRLVFDQYKDSSLKEQMRKKRTKGKSTYYRIQDNSMIPNITLKDFLSHVKTKSELAEYFATKMLVHSQSDQNRLNKFMVTAGTKTKGNIDVPDNLASHSQEEADTLLLLHATTISDDAELTISSPDTDVFLQIIRMYPKLPKEVFFLTGKSKQRRKIPIRPIYEKIGPKQAAALLGFHSFTGSDMCGRFTGRTKDWCLKVFLACDIILDALALLGRDEMRPSLETMAHLERFVCLLYRSKVHAQVDDLRWFLYSARGAEGESLPPTRGSLISHILRGTT